MQQMQVTTSRFGVLTAPEEQTIRIEGGLLGIPDAEDFIRVPVPDAPGWIWLQSITTAELAFLAIRAFDFFPDYDPDMAEIDALSIGIEQADEADVLALVTVSRDSDGQVKDISANLLGPIVIHSQTLRARQIVLADSSYSAQTPLDN